MNTSAQRARDVARQRHLRQLMVWRGIAGLCFALFLGTLYWYVPSGVWRTDEAPKLEPLHVVTRAYVDKRGNWRSYDNGEKITVTHWTTK